MKNLTKAERKQITIYWSLKEETGAPVESITIEYRETLSAKNGWTRYAINKPIRTYTVSNLVKGTRYEFRIRASNQIGNGEYSKSVQISTRDDKSVIN